MYYNREEPRWKSQDEVYVYLLEKKKNYPENSNMTSWEGIPPTRACLLGTLALDSLVFYI